MHNPQTLEELIDLAEELEACDEGIRYARKFDSVEALYKSDMPPEYAYWLLTEDFCAFAEHCDWSKFDDWRWLHLLQLCPEYSEHCDWGRLSFSGLDWSCLLAVQPQFSEHCDWGKLDKSDWNLLLENQPQFAVHLPIKKEN